MINLIFSFILDMLKYLQVIKLNIVLCGSMKVKEKILEIDKKLKEMGLNTLLPKECLEGKDKLIASKAHFDRISSSISDAILVINESTNNIPNYIGPNTFAEIAFAFYFNKKVYLLNDIYEPFKDELVGWQVECLKGDLTKIK